MEIEILNVHGYGEALYGLGLSYGLTSGIPYEKFRKDVPLFFRMKRVAAALAKKDPSESKFLRCITVNMLVRAPRFWFQELDQYHFFTSLSESTRHTLGKRQLKEEDFEDRNGYRSIFLPNVIEDVLNFIIQKEGADSENIRMMLPESFLQRRMISTNYAQIRTIIHQRWNHKLPQWHYFCREMLEQLPHSEFLQDLLPENYE